MAMFYLDENISVLLTGELESRGHEVAPTRGESRLGASDPHQLLYAAERNWTIVTRDGRHFRLLHDAWLLWSDRWGTQQSHAGILVLQSFEGQTAEDMANAITALLRDPHISLDTALYEWKRSTGWVRFPG